MTYKKFYSELRKLRGEYRVTKKGTIRACNRETGYCPIVGVSKRKGGPDSFSDGGIYLGLSENQISTIIDAADCCLTTPTIRRVRRSLLTTLNLKELE